MREIREAVVASANARGGHLVLGVSDRKRTRAEAIHGVAHLNATTLRRDIYDGTEPHILVEINEIQEPEGRLLVIRVPPGMPPHTTTDGVARIRVGKDSKPLTGSNLANLVVSRGGRDLTGETLPDVSFSDFDPDQFRRMRRLIRADADRTDLAELDDLARRYAPLLQSPDAAADIWLDEESVRMRLLAILPERGRLTNAEIRRMSGYSRSQVVRLMRSLREEGLVQVKGRGRGAHYVPASPRRL